MLVSDTQNWTLLNCLNFSESLLREQCCVQMRRHKCLRNTWRQSSPSPVASYFETQFLFSSKRSHVFLGTYHCLSFFSTIQSGLFALSVFLGHSLKSWLCLLLPTIRAPFLWLSLFSPLRQMQMHDQRLILIAICISFQRNVHEEALEIGRW